MATLLQCLWINTQVYKPKFDHWEQEYNWCEHYDFSKSQDKK